jgi:hypothetical protein
MTLFINLRASANGGIVAAEASAWDDGALYVSPKDFANRIEGRDVLFATHGFNVDQLDGIKALSMWSQRCKLPDSWLFVGVLWAGDSRFLPVVDYVYEGVEAISSGKLLASYLNQNAMRAQSISFVSHSLGARTLLETVRGLETNPRRLILMAGAIENDCLVREYADAAAKASEIYVLSSRSDVVLEWAFPAGNLIGEIIMHGHPYDRTALGRNGPLRPIPSSLHVGAWQIPDVWDYGHLDYLPKDQIGPAFPLPVVEPGPDTGVPVDQNDPVSAGWKPAWSAGAVATKAA